MVEEIPSVRDRRKQECWGIMPGNLQAKKFRYNPDRWNFQPFDKFLVIADSCILWGSGHTVQGSAWTTTGRHSLLWECVGTTISGELDLSSISNRFDKFRFITDIDTLARLFQPTSSPYGLIAVDGQIFS